MLKITVFIKIKSVIYGSHKKYFFMGFPANQNKQNIFYDLKIFLHLKMSRQNKLCQYSSPLSYSLSQLTFCIPLSPQCLSHCSLYTEFLERLEGVVVTLQIGCISFILNILLYIFTLQRSVRLYANFITILGQIIPHVSIMALVSLWSAYIDSQYVHLFTE